MGRRKIAIEPLTDERNRSVTFLKRKAGLFKKAHELAVLCQADITVIIFGHNKKVYEFSSGDTEEIIRKYHQTQPHESKGPHDFDPTVKRNLRNDVTEDEDDIEEDSSSGDELSVPTRKQQISRKVVSKRSSTSNSKRSSDAIDSKHKTDPSSNKQALSNIDNHQLHHARRGTDSSVQISSNSSSGQHRYSRSQGSINSKQEPSLDAYEYVQHQQQNQYEQNQQHHQISKAHSQTLQTRSSSSSQGDPQQQQQQHNSQSVLSQNTSDMHQNYSNPSGIQFLSQVQQPSYSRYLRASESPQTEYNYVETVNRHQMFAVPPPQRSASVDVPPLVSRPVSDHSLRPKLKVQIPLGESSEGISSSEKSKDKIERENSQPVTSSGAISTGPNSSSGTSQASGSTTGGPGPGGSWGSAVLLPPPSPSSYLNTGNPVSGVGPGNPFGRPPLVNNGEQTPLSAALPSKYVNDLLPSPSNFYGSEWNIHFGTGQTPTSSTAGPVASVASSSAANVGMGISLNGPANFPSYRSHLTNDMLPSPLQFNTPVVATSSSSLLLGSSPTSDKKRENTSQEQPVSSSTASSSKRLKLNR